MDKRQKKKQAKNISKRLAFFGKHFIYSARLNGKTYMYGIVKRAVFNKHYKPFKELAKFYKKLLVSVDLGYKKDYGVETVARISKGKVNIIRTQIVDELHEYRG